MVRRRDAAAVLADDPFELAGRDRDRPDFQTTPFPHIALHLN
jgi:hypothetical protein